MPVRVADGSRRHGAASPRHLATAIFPFDLAGTRAAPRDPVPGPLHEEIIELLRREPLFALEELQRRGVLVLPPFTEIEILPGEIREILATERRADVVVLLRAGTPVFVIVIEVQTTTDRKKRLSWPVYVTNLRAKYNCPAVLVVFATDDNVRSWAAEPIALGHPGFQLVPLVVGPEQIPRVTDPEEARAAPYRAILSALVHADQPGAEHLVLAAYDGIATLEAGEVIDDMDWRALLDDALASNEVARKALSLMIDVQAAKARSSWVREAREEGREEGLRSSIASVLAARGLAMSPEQRAVLDGCHDVAMLERWITQAALAATAEEALR